MREPNAPIPSELKRDAAGALDADASKPAIKTKRQILAEAFAVANRLDIDEPLLVVPPEILNREGPT